MSIFKCKICGGSLEFSEGSTVACCQYCGTKQTLPKISDGNNSTLYERADHFRRNNDFDKAISIYEQILNADNTDAEAYWSLVLCRYGIEYVEDPKSNKRIATVNRMQYTSVLADEDYKSALKYADAEQKEIYEVEAKEIDSIQKGILAISQKEEPFDVFICYKETDNSGRRTLDSVLANDLYHQLTNAGYKVFFSRITLENKLGTAYEPYIFAALNSAKVMVVLGTNPEYFNAVWVKNEWSRFLALIKNGANKVLIPAYRDMDPYDLPEEFSHLQAQDMSKLGFMQDLIRGIEKLTKPSNPKYVKEQPTMQSGANTAPLLRRVYLFLEDGDWNSANEYCEKVLDIDPECGEAYVGKMMVDLKVRQREKLSEQAEPFDNNSNYQKALRFGDAKLQNELKNYIETITNRAEHTRLLEIYKKAQTLFATAKTEEDYISASKVYSSISDFEDSEIKANTCKERANEIHFSGLYATALALMKSAKTEEDFAKASKVFLDIKEYKDSESKAKECADKADSINKNAIYSAAVALMTGNKAKNYKKAIVEFEKIRGFKDTDQKIEYCNQKIEQINSALSAAGLERQAKAEERAEAFKEKLPLIKKIAIIVVPVLVIAIVAVTVLPKINWSKNTTADATDSSLNSSSEESESSVTSEDVTSEEQNSTESTNSSETSSTTSNKTESSKPQNTQTSQNSNPLVGQSQYGFYDVFSTVRNTDINPDYVITLHYNYNGVVIAETKHDKSNNKIEESSFIYDAKEDAIIKMIINRYESGKLSQKQVITNFIFKGYISSLEGIFMGINFKYEYFSESTYYNTDGSVKSYEEFKNGIFGDMGCAKDIKEYNSKKQLVKHTLREMKLENGVICTYEKVTTYTYNPDGSITTEVTGYLPGEKNNSQNDVDFTVSTG